MNKICTNYEQSKKLQELGLGPDTADMAWYDSYAESGHSFRILNKEYPLDMIGEEHDEVPAWSLGALFTLTPYISLSGCDHGLPYICSYSDDDISRHFTYGNDPIDAVYEMIAHLLRNKNL